MPRNLYCHCGHIAGIYLLLYTTKVQMFDCDKHSVKGTLTCTSGECCTPELTNVIKADVTWTNYLCGFGSLYDIQDKLPGQKCVALSVPCHVQLSYCYTDEKLSTGQTLPTLSPNVTSENHSIPISANKTESPSINGWQTNVNQDYPPNAKGSIDKSVTDRTIHAFNSEGTARNNIQRSLKDGVTIGIPVAAFFLIVTFISTFLFIRHRRKRRKEATFDTVLRMSKADHAQTGYSGNSHEHNDPIDSTNLELHGIADDKTIIALHGVAEYTADANMNQRNNTLEQGEIYKYVPTDISDYANVQGTCLMEDGDHDKINFAEVDKTYDHISGKDCDNTYDSTYQEHISFDDNYDKTNHVTEGEYLYE